MPVKQPFSLFQEVMLLGLALMILLIPIKIPFSIYDEGFAVFNATRIMNGDIPYKDFWAIYPPGQFYTLAILFKTFGTSLFVARVYDTFVRFIIVLSIWSIAKKITSRIPADLALITTALLLGSAKSYTYAIFPALALGLLSILNMLKYIETVRLYWLILAGILVGFTALFRWDIGLYVGISIFATLFLFFLFRTLQGSTFFTKILFVPSEVFIFSGIALFVTLAGFGYLGFRSGFENFWEQVVIFPTMRIRDVRWLPYPALLSPSEPDFVSWLRFYFPLFVYSIAFSCYVYFFRNKQIAHRTQYFGSISVTILGILLFAQALSRYDYIHIVPTSLAAILVIFSLLAKIVFKSANLTIKLACILLLIGAISLYAVLPANMLFRNFKAFVPLGCFSRIERASCISLSKDQERAIRYIQARTATGEAIFVGNQRHDRIYENDIGFYFLSAHQSATRYHELYPGVATTLPVQETIVQEIQSRNIKWIVLVDIPESMEPNLSAHSSGIRYLDDFIRSNYFLAAEFGSYQILERETR